MHVIILFALSCVTVSASPLVSSNPQRIVGGSPTTIDNYPSLVGSLIAHDFVNFMHICGGAILNERSILTAAHCDVGGGPTRYRVRVGSTYGNSGGTVHNVARIINHPDYNPTIVDNDIGILHTATHITLSNVVQLGTIAGPNLQVPHNSEVWAAGWGLMENNVKPEQLRHVALALIENEQCVKRFFTLTANMLCAGPINDTVAGQCNSDSGSPLYYKGIIVGVGSFTYRPCGRPDAASVSARVSRYTSWILENVF